MNKYEQELVDRYNELGIDVAKDAGSLPWPRNLATDPWPYKDDGTLTDYALTTLSYLSPLEDWEEFEELLRKTGRYDKSAEKA